jgi:Mn2+/Fe2+ NRAMP family transporter
MRSSYLARLLTYLMVMGPGLVVMEADNDAGAWPLTPRRAGNMACSCYGCSSSHLLSKRWGVRLGIATSEGHAAMIYLRFGPWWVWYRCAICTSSTSDPGDRI